MGLRLHGLTYQSFWFDELWTYSYWVSAGSIGEVWKSLWVPIEGNLPFYPIFIHIWAHIFGDSEFILRLPSAIAGSLFPLTIFLTTLRLLNFRAALFTSILSLSLLPLLFHSQEARTYSFLALFVSLNLYGWLFFEEKKSKIAWCLASVLLCWSHYFGVLILLLQFFESLIAKRDRIKFFLLVTLFTFPLLPLVFYQIQGGPDLPASFFSFFNDVLVWALDVGFDYITLVLMFLFLAGCLLSLPNEKFRFLMRSAIFPYLVYLAFWLGGKNIVSERYFIVILPPVLLLIGFAVDRIWSTQSRPAQGLVVSLLSFCLISPLLNSYYTKNTNADYRGAVEYVARNYEVECPAEVVVTNPRIWQFYSRQHPNLKFVRQPNNDDQFWFLNAGFDFDEFKDSRFYNKYSTWLKYEGHMAEALCLEEKVP